MGLEGFHLHLPCLTARQESRSSGVSTASKPRIPGKQKSLAVFAYKTIRVDRMSLGRLGDFTQPTLALPNAERREMPQADRPALLTLYDKEKHVEMYV